MFIAKVFVLGLTTLTACLANEKVEGGSWNVKLGDGGVGYHRKIGELKRLKDSEGYGAFFLPDSVGDWDSAQKTKIVIFENDKSDKVVSEFMCNIKPLRINGNAEYTIHSVPGEDGINKPEPVINGTGMDVARLGCEKQIYSTYPAKKEL